MGLSGAFGPNPTGRSNRTEVYGADLSLKVPIARGRVVVALLSEWAVRRRQVPGQVLQDVTGLAELRVGLPAARLHLAARYQYESGITGDPQHLDGPTGAFDRHLAEAGVLFQPTRWSLLRLSGSLDLSNADPDARGIALLDVLRLASTSAAQAGPGYSVLLGLQMALGGAAGARHASPVLE